MLRCHRIVVGLLGALALLGATAPVAVAAPAPTGMGWTVIDRYGGDPSGVGKLEDENPLTPADLDAFAVRVLPSTAVCGDLDSAAWRVDGAPADPLLERGENCAATIVVKGEGEHRVKVLARNRAEVARITVDDQLIVALGDSVASGEGNPESPGHWLDSPCHRSAAAGFEQAARQLGEVDRRRSITFVSLACSGARIDRGLIESYDGIAPKQGDAPYPPQVERLRKIVARRLAGGDEGSGVDAVLLSIGANDIRFSSIVKQCALLGDCRAGAKEAVDRRLATLDDSYDKLGTALGEAAPEVPVMITEYFDPTHGEDGRFCTDGPGLTSRKEAQWAYERLLRPLNLEVAAAANRNGWQPIDGIAADFNLHGYCAAKKPWVRTLPEAVAIGNPAGTLHPNEAGHKAIARRVAGPLAALLHFQAPVPPPEAESDGGSPGLKEIGAAAVAVALAPQALISGVLLEPDPHSTWRQVLAFWLLLPVLIALLWLALRALLILRATWPEDPVGARRAPPQLPEGRIQLSLRHLLLIGLGLAVFFAAMVVLAGLVGRAILWLRFWSAHLPADQAVNAVSGSELVSTGAVALAIFVGLGLLAAAIAWLLDGKGREVRTTRRGLVAIGLAEVLVAIWIGEFRDDQGLQLFAGVVIAALLLHYLVDRALDWGNARREKALATASTASAAKDVWIGLKAAGKAFFCSDEGWLLRIWKLLPFGFLALALYLATWTEGFDRRFALGAYLLTAVLFAAPGGLAAAGVRWRKPVPATLTVPRIALALVGLALVVILLVRDEPWLAGVAATAALLGLLCLAVAAASGERFAPYGLAVLVSVPLFAGAAAFLHGVDSPELQPVAVVLADGEAVCGAYVGESDDQLWLASLVLDERAGAHRPQRGSIAPIDADEVEGRSLGPMEPVDLVDIRARELRDQMLDEKGDEDPVHRAPICAPSPQMKRSLAQTEARPQDDPDLELAEEYQPELVIDRHDGFWPVPVETLFSVRDRRASICRRVAARPDGCLRLGTPGQFPWIGGQGESLEYPAADNDLDEQHDQMVAALGTSDPEASATEYYLVHRDPSGRGPISIQYWFFYPFNYQPAGEDFVPGGFHEGDFEAIGVLLSAHKKEPRYVWMNRHNEEGRAFPWSDDALSRPEGHPRVFAARGSHATYENCEGQVRPFNVKGLIDDHPTCNEDRQLHLMPEVTPLIDLARVGWGCWQGLFGHRKGGVGIYESLPALINDAPRSPLWQQKFGGVEVQPCRGIPDPGGRDGLGEEVLEERTGVPAELRERASPLENAIDQCSDWEKPATSGIYMVACSGSALEGYVESGLEDAGPAKVQIEAAGDAGGPDDPLAVPAVRRNRRGAYLSDWRISASKETRVTVYASCPSGGGIVAARFEDVRVEPGEPLTLRDQGPGGTWILVKPDGSAPWEAVPFTTRAKDGTLVRRAPRPGKYLPCEAPDG